VAWRGGHVLKEFAHRERVCGRHRTTQIGREGRRMEGEREERGARRVRARGSDRKAKRGGGGACRGRKRRPQKKTKAKANGCTSAPSLHGFYPRLPHITATRCWMEARDDSCAAWAAISASWASSASSASTRAATQASQAAISSSSSGVGASCWGQGGGEEDAVKQGRRREERVEARCARPRTGSVPDGRVIGGARAPPPGRPPAEHELWSTAHRLGQFPRRPRPGRGR